MNATTTAVSIKSPRRKSARHLPEPDGLHVVEVPAYRGSERGEFSPFGKVCRTFLRLGSTECSSRHVDQRVNASFSAYRQCRQLARIPSKNSARWQIDCSPSRILAIEVQMHWHTDATLGWSGSDHRFQPMMSEDRRIVSRSFFLPVPTSIPKMSSAVSTIRRAPCASRESHSELTRLAV